MNRVPVKFLNIIPKAIIPELFVAFEGSPNHICLPGSQASVKKHVKRARISMLAMLGNVEESDVVHLMGIKSSKEWLLIEISQFPNFHWFFGLCKPSQ